MREDEAWVEDGLPVCLGELDLEPNDPIDGFRNGAMGMCLTTGA